MRKLAVTITSNNFTIEWSSEWVLLEKDKFWWISHQCVPVQFFSVQTFCSQRSYGWCVISMFSPTQMLCKIRRFSAIFNENEFKVWLDDNERTMNIQLWEKKHQMNFGNKVQRFYHDHAALHSCAMWNMCIHFSWEIICFSWHYCIQSDTFKFALNILENSQNRNSKLFCVIKHHKL